mmetsp:Transcript_6644/g.19412  ORF Transcript_6644/g.19412 Transcript_6644/m.19412 type:complete len:1025 (-) Transcript_6644:351-3425(-)
MQAPGQSSLASAGRRARQASGSGADPRMRDAVHAATRIQSSFRGWRSRRFADHVNEVACEQWIEWHLACNQFAEARNLGWDGDEQAIKARNRVRARAALRVATRMQAVARRRQAKALVDRRRMAREAEAEGLEHFAHVRERLRVGDGAKLLDDVIEGRLAMEAICAAVHARSGRTAEACAVLEAGMHATLPLGGGRPIQPDERIMALRHALAQARRLAVATTAHVALLWDGLARARRADAGAPLAQCESHMREAARQHLTAGGSWHWFLLRRALVSGGHLRPLRPTLPLAAAPVPTAGTKRRASERRASGDDSRAAAAIARRFHGGAERTSAPTGIMSSTLSRMSSRVSPSGAQWDEPKETNWTAVREDMRAYLHVSALRAAAESAVLGAANEEGEEEGGGARGRDQGQGQRQQARRAGAAAGQGAAAVPPGGVEEAAIRQTVLLMQGAGAGRLAALVVGDRFRPPTPPPDGAGTAAHVSAARKPAEAEANLIASWRRRLALGLARWCRDLDMVFHQLHVLQVAVKGSQDESVGGVVAVAGGAGPAGANGADGKAKAMGAIAGPRGGGGGDAGVDGKTLGGRRSRRSSRTLRQLEQQQARLEASLARTSISVSRAAGSAGSQGESLRDDDSDIASCSSRLVSAAGGPASSASTSIADATEDGVIAVAAAAAAVRGPPPSLAQAAKRRALALRGGQQVWHQPQGTDVLRMLSVLSDRAAPPHAQLAALSSVDPAVLDAAIDGTRRVVGPSVRALLPPTRADARLPETALTAAVAPEPGRQAGAADQGRMSLRALRMRASSISTTTGVGAPGGRGSGAGGAGQSGRSLEWIQEALAHAREAREAFEEEQHAARRVIRAGDELGAAVSALERTTAATLHRMSAELIAALDQRRRELTGRHPFAEAADKLRTAYTTVADVLLAQQQMRRLAASLEASKRAMAVKESTVIKLQRLSRSDVPHINLVRGQLADVQEQLGEDRANVQELTQRHKVLALSAATLIDEEIFPDLAEALAPNLPGAAEHTVAIR